MTPKVFLDNFFLEKMGKESFKKIKTKNLISDGLIDSLDIVTLSFLIKKRFKIDIKVNEKNIALFNSYDKLLNKIKTKKSK